VLPWVLLSFLKIYGFAGAGFLGATGVVDFFAGFAEAAPAP
jgi:hypothetical protein